MATNALEDVDFSLVRGGPFYRLQQRVGLVRGRAHGLGRRVLFFWALSWPPLAILSAARGSLIGEPLALPFLGDIAVHLRLWLSVPLLIASEGLVDPQVAAAVRELLRARLVPESQRQRFDDAVQATARLRDSMAGELVVLALAFGNAYVAARMKLPGLSTWERAQGAVAGLTPAGWWHALVSLPLYHFLLLRWMWRVVIWGTFLWRMAGIPLRLTALHPDLAGGLGFLEMAHASFASVIFAVTWTWAARWRERIVLGSFSPASFETSLVGFVVLVLLVFVGPLCAFSFKLYRLRGTGLRHYGGFGSRYTLDFERKWLEREPDQSPLGTQDIQALADLGSSFDVVRRMKLLPIGKVALGAYFAAVAIPVLLLVGTVIPLGEVLGKVLKPFL